MPSITDSLDDAAKLELLAQWFDNEQDERGRWRGGNGSREVQEDLRRIARKLRAEKATAELKRSMVDWEWLGDDRCDLAAKVEAMRAVVEAAIRETRAEDLVSLVNATNRPPTEIQEACNEYDEAKRARRAALVAVLRSGVPVDAYRKAKGEG